MASKNVTIIDDENFDREVMKAGPEPYLLDFGAVWCSPCKALLPVVEAVADETVGRARVGKIDIDDAPGVARRFGIRSAPTLVIVKEGREVGRHVGTCGKDKILALLG